MMSWPYLYMIVMFVLINVMIYKISFLSNHDECYTWATSYNHNLFMEQWRPWCQDFTWTNFYSTLYNIWLFKKTQNGLFFDPLPWFNKLRKFTSKKRRHLKQLISQNKYLTCSELKNTLNQLHPNLNVSSRTILNEVYNLKYHYIIFKIIPFLTTIYKQNHVK